VTDLANTEHAGNRQQDAMLPYYVLSDALSWSFRQRRVVQLWPGVIFNCVSYFLVKKHAAFKWKDAISGFPVSPGSAEALVRWGGKIKHILIAYFLSNICAKNCRSRTMYVKIISSQRWDVFLRHSVVGWLINFAWNILLLNCIEILRSLFHSVIAAVWFLSRHLHR